jgi:DNA-binding NarL/FixJ family response regulator
VVMDIQMPELDGVAATREIVDAGDARVLVVTTFDVDDYVYEALRAGASGFLLKNAPPEELVRAIHVVAAGDSLLSPSVTRRVVAEFARRAPGGRPSAAGLEELTEREREVFALVARGLSNAEIAEQLVVSRGTVKTHVARILMKLQLRDRVQAVVMAYEAGLVEPGAGPP